MKEEMNDALPINSALEESRDEIHQANYDAYLLELKDKLKSNPELAELARNIGKQRAIESLATAQQGINKAQLDFMALKQRHKELIEGGIKDEEIALLQGEVVKFINEKLSYGDIHYALSPQFENAYTDEPDQVKAFKKSIEQLEQRLNTTYQDAANYRDSLFNRDLEGIKKAA